MKIIFSIIFFCHSCLVFSQNKLKEFVQSNTMPVLAISPDSTDFSDLEGIGDAIGNSRIVMLGEQDHGDAPSFSAKTRLIQFLHEKKGFNVIAFESDFFSATYGFEKTAKTKLDFLNFCKANIVPYWTLCDAAFPLFNKIIPESFNSKNPFIIAGIDNQMFYRFSSKNLAHYIDSISRAYDAEFVKNSILYDSILSAIRILSNPITCNAQNKSFYKNALNGLQILKEDIMVKAGADNIACILIDNVSAFTQQLLRKNNFTSMVNIRDIQMAENLNWLCYIKFPTEKVIVWAANYHISKFMGHFKKTSLNDNISMAGEFTKDTVLDKTTYIIGFTSFEGEAGRIGTKIFKVDPPKKNGFETWIDEKRDFAFIDFRKFNLLNPNYDLEFDMKSCVTDNNVHKSYPGQWNRIFDGIFFIRNMYPCRIKQ